MRKLLYFFASTLFSLPYVGFDISQMKLHQEITEKGNFLGGVIGYEYLNALYFHARGVGRWGHLEDSHASDFFLEVRVGYSCDLSSLRFTPYTGIVYDLFRYSSPFKTRHDQTDLLLALLIDKEWDHFSIGINLQPAFVFWDEKCYRSSGPFFGNTQQGKKSFHFVVEAPITYHHCMSFSLVPYYRLQLYLPKEATEVFSSKKEKIKNYGIQICLGRTF